MRVRGKIRRVSWGLVLAAALATGACGDEPEPPRAVALDPPPVAAKPTPPSTREIAQAFLAAFDVDDTVRQRALMENGPDPWRLAEHLLTLPDIAPEQALAAAKAMAALDGATGDDLTAYLGRPGLVATWRAHFPRLHVLETTAHEQDPPAFAPIDDAPYLNARFASLTRDKWRARGRNDEAQTAAGRAITAAREAKWIEGTAEAYEIYANLLPPSEQAQARAAYEKAGRLYAQLGLRPDACRCFGNVASLYGALGELRKALEWFPLVVDDPFADTYDKALALSSQATTFARLDREAEALDAYQRSIDAFESIGKAREAAVSRSMLAGECAKLGDTQEALRVAGEAWKILGQESDSVDLGVLLVNRGMAHRLVGAWNEALADHERARRIFDTRGHARLLGVVRHHIGYALLEMGQLDQAEEVLLRAREAAVQDKQFVALTAIDCSLGKLALARNQPVIAREHYVAAFERALPMGLDFNLVTANNGIAESWLRAGRNHKRVIEICSQTAQHRIPALAYGLATRPGAHVRGVHAAVFDTGLRACLAVDDKEHGFEFLESGRAGQLVEELIGRRTYRRATSSPLARESAFDEYLERQFRLSEDIRTDGLTAERTMSAMISVQDPSDAMREISLANTQSALGRDQVLLLYGRVGTRCVVGVVRRDGMDLLDRCAWAELEQTCRDVPADGEPDLESARGPLSRLLLEGLIHAKDRHVLVSPVDLLTRVPFGALLPDRDVTLVPSAAVWTHLLRRKARAPRTGILGICEVPARAGFSALPASAVVRRFAGPVLAGRDATPKAVRDAIGAPRKAVHFACHASIDPRDGFRSGLVLAGSEKDHRLTVEDLLHVRLDCDLVFLSACSSGGGPSIAAEGLMGLARAFLVAGADRVIVSLWPVRDQEAAAFAVRFYEHWREGVSASQALREARGAADGDQAWVLWGRTD